MDTLGFESRRTIEASTPLLGGIPRLGLLAVVELAQALEDQFGFDIDDSEFTGDVRGRWARWPSSSNVSKPNSSFSVRTAMLQRGRTAHQSAGHFVSGRGMLTN